MPHACGASKTSEENKTVLDTQSMSFLRNHKYSVLFSLCTLCSMPAALRRPHNKNRPGFSEHVTSDRPSQQLLQTLPKLTQALPEPLVGQAWARGGFGPGGHRIHRNHMFWLKWNSSLDLPDLPEVVSGAAAQDVPSTRARGQDDVSSEQTPSNHKATVCT